MSKPKVKLIFSFVRWLTMFFCVFEGNCSSQNMAFDLSSFNQFLVISNIQNSIKACCFSFKANLEKAERFSCVTAQMYLSSTVSGLNKT